MGTLVQVVVFARDEAAAKAAFRTAFDRIQELDRILSDYQPDSELNALTRSAVGRPVPVGPDLFTVLSASQQLARATGGAFDITQGPVIRLWRRARHTGRLPDPAALQEAAARSGYGKLHLDQEHRTVMLDAERMALDVGGIAKGYAAGEALAALSMRGVQHALVAVSGDIAVSEAPPGQRGWRISIHDADPALSPIPEVLELSNAAVSTSGSSAQHLDVEERRYSHIVEPSSRTGLVGDLTVTVVARRGIEADGLATAVSVLGARDGLAFVESRSDAAALIVDRGPEGTTFHQSSRFQALASGSLPMQSPLGQLGWLGGCWQSGSGDRTTMEMWLPPARGLMIGASRTVAGGQVREYEHLRLRADGGTLVYTALPSRQRETDFRSTSAGADGFRVENLQHDFPQRITYTRTGADTMTVRVEGAGAGEPRGFDLAFQRTPCESAPGPPATHF